MSVAWYVVLERKIPGFEIFINGKALGHASELLDSLARDEGVLPLSAFFSASTEELTGFASDHGVDLQELGTAPPEKWFLPEDGLRTLDALMKAAESRKIEEHIVKDLRDFQAVLQTAQANGVRWHLAVDF
jgi:hypothetical protein